MQEESLLLFAGWLPIMRVIIVGVLGYVFLLLALRTVGPRTLARTNMFDFIIMVSIGSVFGRILTAKDVPLVEACVAYSLLMAMHYGVSWLRVRSRWLAAVLDARPTLVFYRGNFIDAAMRRHRLIRDDLEMAMRRHGLACAANVEAIVLEADGGLSVIQHKDREYDDLLPIDRKLTLDSKLSSTSAGTDSTLLNAGRHRE